MLKSQSSACLFCGNDRLAQVFVYDARPARETPYAFSSGRYHREIWRCCRCGHLTSVHDMDDAGLYAGAYVDTTYGADGIRRAFERINALDPAQSDNVGRVRRIVDFWATHGPTRESRTPTVLDVGSGLCVFLHRLKASGWDCTALDPDPRAVQHAREVVGVKTICADFMAADHLGQFDLVTFNKVLEHVKDPVAMLTRSVSCLRPGGWVYVEVPDGEAAASEGKEREEFFVEHPHIFSGASLALLAARAGLSISRLERIREPSSKLTLFTFLQMAFDKPLARPANTGPIASAIREPHVVQHN